MSPAVSSTQSQNSIWLRASKSPSVVPSAARLWEWLAEQIDAALYRPCPGPDVLAQRLHEDGVTYYVLKNPANNAYLKLSESDYTLWKWMDGSRSVKDLVIAYFEQFKTLALSRVTTLVAELKASGFLLDKPVGVFQQAQEQLAQRDWGYRWRKLAALFIQHEFRLDGIDGWITGLYRLGGWLLFTPVAQVLFVILSLVGLIAFVNVLAGQRYAIVLTGGSYWLGLLLLWAANLGVIFIHEHAHALMTKHFKREVKRGGFLIYYGMPAFYVDTMDVWLEPKLRRIAVTWAGPYSGLILGGACGLMAMLAPSGLAGQLAFKTAFVCYLGLLVNLNPLLELDGYFILIDWLGVPNLRERSFAFMRTELWPKLQVAFASATAVDRASAAAKGKQALFNREETIFTAFGALAAVYTIYTLIVAVYFWQTRFSGLLFDLWAKPSWVAKAAAVVFGAGVVVPVGLVVVATVLSASRGLLRYLEKRRFFESNQNVTALLFGGLLGVMLAPALLHDPARIIYMALLPVGLMTLAVIMLIQVARQHAGARFQATFWALTASAACLMVGTLARLIPGELIFGFEQLAALPLLVVAFQSLLEVDVRHGTLWERGAVIAILALNFVVVIPVAQWTAGQALWVVALAAAGPSLTLIFVAAIVPTLALYINTRFFVPWVVLAAAVALNGALSMARLSPNWLLRPQADLWLGLLAAGLWALGSLDYVTAGSRLRHETAHWSEDLLLSDSERLRLAFGRFVETLFNIFRAAHGERRAKAVDDDLDVLAVAANWNVEIESGQVHDELDLSKITILDQADRYRDVLARAIDLMDDWAGSAFVARATQAAYDSLPWPERETLGQYVLSGSLWGGMIARQFDDVRSERYRLLRQVPLLAGCRNRAMALLMAAVNSETVPAGAVLGRQGSSVTRFVIVQSGAVEKWVKAGTKSRAELAGILRRGASLGSEAFMGGGAYTGTYRAAVATDILYLSLEECEQLRRAGVKLATQVGQVLAVRQLLGQMPLFASMGPQQLDALAHKMGHQEAQSGSVIVQQGEERHHLYIIASGQVEICAAASDGQEHVVAQLGPGQHFGETSLYEDVPYSATCRATQPTVLLTMDESTFDQVVGSSVRMTHYVEQVSSGRVIDTRRKLGLTGVM